MPTAASGGDGSRPLELDARIPIVVLRRRHDPCDIFDCIGFVNHCLCTFTHRRVHFDIAVRDRRALQQLTRPHEQTSRPSVISSTHGVEGHAADLVLRGSHHIGMLTGDGWVIRAQGEFKGVMQAHYSPTAWKNLIRLPRGRWTGS